MGVTVTDYAIMELSNGTLEEYLPATTFGAPASFRPLGAGHVGWRAFPSVLSFYLMIGLKKTGRGSVSINA